MSESEGAGPLHMGRVLPMFFPLLIGGLLLAALVLLAPAFVWAPVLAIAALGGLASFFRRTFSPAPPPEFGYVQEAAPSTEVGRIAEVRLPSNRPDYFFVFSANVVWTHEGLIEGHPAVNLDALARNAIVRRARDLVRRWDPEYVSLAAHELADALAEMVSDATGRVRAMAQAVKLSLPEDDRQRLDELATVRKTEAVWEHQRKQEQSLRRYLGDDVLKDPGSAVVWWLARNDESLDGTVERISDLRYLADTANNVPPPREPERSATDHFGAMLDRLGLSGDDPQRNLFAREVADSLAENGFHDVADEIKDRFDPPRGSAEEAPGPEARPPTGSEQ
ncbi:hypothetical protein amrb99_66840 [Actinomadura sp. RB99]|uniref:hypothetical protein n=1 Tax=Actinomadura sp. RB99 TaxID=2691577 RepID=UPI001688FBF3|nr:hypothetical protein [Actinomadura sp. RB99]MBD2897720.1 hypothetical protein [Actinomadura sp. RB99]